MSILIKTYRKRLVQLFLIGGVLFASACSKESGYQRTSQTLDMAGANKGELKRVLRHFSKNQEDSLKLESAFFLIEHMHWHQGDFIKPPDLLLKAFIKEDSLVKEWHGELRIPNWQRNQELKHQLDSFQLNTKPEIITQSKITFHSIDKNRLDAQSLSADFLIQHIDHSHQVWEKHRNKLNVDYENFQKSILPYSVSNEPLVPLHSFMHHRFNNLFFSELNKHNRDSLIQNANTYLSWFGGGNLEQLQMGMMSFMAKGKMGCYERTVSVVNIFRSMGFPTELDFTPIWLDNPNRHYWCNMPFRDTAVYFDAQSIYINNKFKNRCLGKVYRKQFKANPTAPYFHTINNETLPSIFSSPCIRDVTNEYIPAKNISIKNTRTVNQKNCYLCVFFPRGWLPLAYGKIDKDGLLSIYKNVPSGLSVASCIYKNGKMEAVSELVYIDNNWNVVPFAANKNKRQSLHLTRKYPWKKHIQEQSLRYNGAKIQGANKADFSDARDIHIINTIKEPKVHLFDGINGGKFRYYRFLPAQKWYPSYVSILQFIGTDTLSIQSETPLSPCINHPRDTLLLYDISEMKSYVGKIIGEGKDLEKCFDGNMLTFSISKWSGMDFGKPVSVDKIIFAPRNGDNGIKTGDVYQLFYWDEGWKDAGKQKAIYNYIRYKDVPTETVYWLRNLSRGKEELPFIYENGQQYFLNFDSLNIGNGKAKRFLY